MGISYKDAGVDIDAGNQFVESIKPLVKETKRSGVMGSIGGFGGLFDLAACHYTDPVLVSATDGVGTKLNLAFDANIHDTVGIDLVAMCVNDLVVQAAEPLFFLDYMATGKLEQHVAVDVIKGIAQGCKEAGCALVGGETAEMPGMYQASHYDLAGFAVGVAERNEILPNTDALNDSDVVLGMASSGIHSNGFSLVRHLIAQHKISLSDPAPFDTSKSLAEALLTPTKIYVKSCLGVKHEVKAFAHITGGGLTENIPRILPDHLAVEINTKSWSTLPVFEWLQDLGDISEEEMLKTFNCGIGMIAVVPAGRADSIQAQLHATGQTVCRIGKIIKSENSGAVVYA